jgi:hypothetical protein
MPQQPTPPPPRPRSVDEKIREQVNDAAISLLQTGFAAIDQIGEVLKDELKKSIIRGIAPPRKK